MRRARVLCGSAFCARTFRRAIFSLLLGLACNCPGNRQLCAINHSSGTLCSPACARSTYREPRKSTSEEQWGSQIAFKRVKKKICLCHNKRECKLISCPPLWFCTLMLCISPSALHAWQFREQVLPTYLLLVWGFAILGRLNFVTCAQNRTIYIRVD